MATYWRNFLVGCALVFLFAGLWALRVELTFEHNVRRGIPADFRLHRTHAVVLWRV